MAMLLAQKTLGHRLPQHRSSTPLLQHRHTPASSLCSHSARGVAVACSGSNKPPQVTSTEDSTTTTGNGLSGSPSKREQERELVALEALPVQETKIETLALWVGAAVAFGAGIWYTEGATKAEEYFAGYLLEQSLSIDNLFVFILVFNYFNTPVPTQGKVLTYGIATAAVLRLVMTLLGVELIEKFQPVLLFFALILIFSSYKLLFQEESKDEDDLTDNFIVRFCQKVIKVSESYDGDNFFTVQNGVKMATPLLLVLAVIELSDVVFAVDSIPAVFGVTLDPFIVYTSNMFAILSLRALYGFVSTAMSELRYLDKAVALVLGFIGVKMVAEFGEVHVPTDVSLLVVGLVLGGGVGASLLLPEARESD